MNFNGQDNILKSVLIDTPLGQMLAISDEKTLYLLEFIERKGLEIEIERLRAKTKSSIIPGTTAPLESIRNELKLYFDGALREFCTKYTIFGSLFQKATWNALLKIPFGETRSYAEIASAIDRPTAYRAVANSNGLNQLAIIIPCHRVINLNGKIGGYAGGIHRKEWLLKHEHKS